jgi:hypothetical protein
MTYLEFVVAAYDHKKLIETPSFIEGLFKIYAPNGKFNLTELKKVENRVSSS